MKRAIAFAAAVLFAACSSEKNAPPPVVCSDETPSDHYVPGLARESVNRMFTVRFSSASPAPPARGVNLWTLELTDPSGARMNVEMLRVKSWMPGLGRGTEPLWSDAAPLADGSGYRVNPFNLFATGFWEFTVEATAGGATDEARLAFCVQGFDLDAGVADDDAGIEPPDSGPLPPACMVTAPTSCPDPSLTYGQVAPIFMERCVVCHDGFGEEWPLTSYRHVADWYVEIREKMLNCSMPPPDAGVDMSNADRQKIVDWLRCGLPR